MRVRWALPSTSSRRRGAAAALLAVVAVLVPILNHAGSGPAWVAAGTSEPDPEAARLAAENTDLRHLLALADRDSLYLVLDLGGGTLSLCQGHARLEDLSVLGLEVGTPRSLRGRRSPPRDWDCGIWKAGTVEPPRRNLGKTLDVSAPDYEDRRREILVPPPPEEAQPAPPVWGIFFQDRRVLEITGVTPSGKPAAGTGSGQLAVPLRQRIRVRVRVAAPDAAGLYRALPDRIPLAVVGGFRNDPPAGVSSPDQGSAVVSSVSSSGAIRARS
jgi:hypothetical protein